MPVPIASHRGGAFLWPENSMTAFRAAAALAAEQIELDVHLSADGDPMVIHDPTLDRTTDAQGPVAARRTAALAGVRLRGAGGDTVPTLAAVLALVRPTTQSLRVELKADAAGMPYPRIVPRVLAELDAAGMRGRTIVMAFHAPTAAEAARAGGMAGTAWLLERHGWRDLGAVGAAAVARAHGVAELGLHEADVDAPALSLMHAAGLRLGVWAANHDASIRRMLALGVDVMTTDDPVLALQLRGELAAP
ncbi:glycerophosphodiester phosphodiesterase [Roseomonas sp. NAR14]|uniref:Glycerophosphodiester phosphodiesterase n=1 Tax=Roseomonas acroporae TaxID=2937791 RepID=A0A9X2BYR1_9PROT|nr:glycerophosphodiester phosphodiesterase family protein [Roseomonas acroporae]MCK8786315.1 glycerophosphodiester phosphodiesterase [Roseomonas acroporae]